MHNVHIGISTAKAVENRVERIRVEIVQVQAAVLRRFHLNAVLEVQARDGLVVDFAPLVVETNEKVLIDVLVAACASARIFVQQQSHACLLFISENHRIRKEPREEKRK
jgi:hypothetical protein